MEPRIHATTRYAYKVDKPHDEFTDEDEDEDAAAAAEDDRKKKKTVSAAAAAAGRPSSAATGGGGGAVAPTCQAELCSADLNDAKRYYRRHKVCEHHSKAPAVVVAGLRQRFCQQCSRSGNRWFHELLEFDEAKRSCRRRLAGHNERRRKNSSDPQGETQAAREGPSKGRLVQAG
ncbi:hypothetical protein Syun_027513 [Stephania yunnanensis]|uniref:SBP-type domain-containing protein n=1 Tax=Stephania yunnanensis TaxID=152371 RepID=A0AAP0EJ28_9MAGN